MSDVNFEALLEYEIKWAMAQREAVPIESTFAPRVKIVGPGGQIAMTPLTWESQQEKRRAMHVLSVVCGQVCARAAIIVSDARRLKCAEFCKHFGIANPEVSHDLETFEQDRLRIMKPYDFDMGKLPAETWEDVLLAMASGPSVAKAMAVRYSASGGRIVFEEIVRDLGDVHVDMLRPWWNRMEAKR